MKSNFPLKHSFLAKRGPVWVAVVFLFLGGVVWRAQLVGAQGGAGSISFSQANYSVNEGAGSAAITLTRTGGFSGKVVGKIGLTDVTTSPADYVFKPGSPDLTWAGLPETQGASFFDFQMFARQSDGKILVAFTPAIRMNADGTRDSSFNPPASNSRAITIAVQPDGKIIVAGGFTTVGGVRKNGVARLNSDGSLDSSFDVGLGDPNVECIAVQADGKILVGGLFTSFNNAPNTADVARLNPDGSVDSTFIKGTSVSHPNVLLIQPDGKILMAGYGVVRLNPDGSTDNSFHISLSGSTGFISALALQPDGKILVSGGFNQVGGQTAFSIARVNSDGSPDLSFNTGTGPDTGVAAIALQPDGKLVVAGTFDFFNGTSVRRIARLNPEGSVDQSFGPGAGSVSGTYIYSLVMQTDGRVLAAGFFSYTSTPVSYRSIGRFNGDLFVNWDEGDSANKTINLPIVDDLLDEPDETLNLTLTPLTGGASGGPITQAALTIVDNDAPPAFTSNTPPQGITKVAYSHTFTASGSPAPTFSVTAGTLPPGLFLQSSGLLSGTPTTAGTFSGITVTASNGVSPVASQTFSLTILSGGTLQFSSSAYSVAENSGPTTVTVTRTGGSAGATAVSYTTFSGSATAGSDFTSTSGILNFADGETSKTFTVTILDDTMDENDETISVSLSNVTGSGSLGTPSSSVITILDDDPPPTISVSDAVSLEGNGVNSVIVFTVRLSAASGKSISFQYATADGTAGGLTDYIPVSGNITIPPGNTQWPITVQLVTDTVVEPDETFTLTIQNPQNATPGRVSATGYIVNDDNSPGNPIDLPGYFVIRQYFDFLNRNADADGFNFWKGTITQCGSDTNCNDVQRINASGAFFLSIEFQQTGYLVERLYKAAYGDAIGASTLPASHQLAVPIVRFSEFVADTQTIGAGVVVLQPGWEQQLETNKQNFVNAFIQRGRFTAIFGTGGPAADFVDRLNLNAGFPLSPAERDQLVNDLSNNVKTRAQVLRSIAEHPSLVSAETDRAFVLMQYFGYLRRNPNDSPDGDYTGYDFWLTKLNQFNGDYIAAEMVKAFISSGEYRKRFGP